MVLVWPRSPSIPRPFSSRSRVVEERLPREKKPLAFSAGERSYDVPHNQCPYPEGSGRRDGSSPGLQA
jgi:hypothetical protein